MVGVHRVHLARRFRQHFGCSTTEYLRHLRVRAAAAALASTETPLATVALDAGFADQSHLCRTFKGETGLTPGAFRALTRR
jgi:AraC family transcriptional regulator